MNRRAQRVSVVQVTLIPHLNFQRIVLIENPKGERERERERERLWGSGKSHGKLTFAVRVTLPAGSWAKGKKTVCLIVARSFTWFGVDHILVIVFDFSFFLFFLFCFLFFVLFCFVLLFWHDFRERNCDGWCGFVAYLRGQRMNQWGSVEEQKERGGEARESWSGVGGGSSKRGEEGAEKK